MSKPLTYDYIKTFIEANSNCILLSTEYKSSKDDLELQCECGEAFTTCFSKFKYRNKRQCTKCGIEKRAELWRRTQSEYENLINELGNQEYVVLGEYTNNMTSVPLMHKVCGHVWDSMPSKFINSGKRCPKCNGGVQKTHEQYKLEFDAVSNGEYELLSIYINATKDVTVKHAKCGNVFEKNAQAFLNCQHCPICGDWRKKTTVDFAKKVKEIVLEEYTVVGDYVKAKEPLEMRHNVCGWTWLISPTNFLTGYRCPHCNQSKGEKRIEEYLKLNNLSYTIQYTFKDCRYKNQLRFDFAVYYHNTVILIEYDGIQHFQPVRFSYSDTNYIKRFEEQLIKDEIKNQYCEKNKIELKRIPYWKYNKIEEILDEIFVNKYANTEVSN